MRAFAATVAVLVFGFFAISAIPNPDPLPPSAWAGTSAREYWRTHCTWEIWSGKKLSPHDEKLCRKVMP